MSEKKIFLIRLASWISVAFIVPLVFIIVRFNLFSKVTKTSVGGWGLVLIIFTIVFVWYLVSCLNKGMLFGMQKQVLGGIRKITLPLICVCLLIYWLENCLDELLEFFIVLTICETIAIPINPIPKWMYENNIEQEAVDLKTLINFLKNKKDK